MYGYSGANYQDIGNGSCSKREAKTSGEFPDTMQRSFTHGRIVTCWRPAQANNLGRLQTVIL
jgi:hypothetical protein